MILFQTFVIGFLFTSTLIALLDDRSIFRRMYSMMWAASKAIINMIVEPVSSLLRAPAIDERVCSMCKVKWSSHSDSMKEKHARGIDPWAITYPADIEKMIEDRDVLITEVVDAIGAWVEAGEPTDRWWRTSSGAIVKAPPPRPRTMNEWDQRHGSPLHNVTCECPSCIGIGHTRGCRCDRCSTWRANIPAAMPVAPGQPKPVYELQVTKVVRIEDPDVMVCNQCGLAAYLVGDWSTEIVCQKCNLELGQRPSPGIVRSY